MELTNKLKRNESQLKEDRKNIIMAEKVREVLKKKIVLSQKILSRDVANENKIMSFTDFINRLNDYVKTLSNIEKDHVDREFYEKEYYTFMREHGDFITLQEYEIDHLLKYVKTSIMRFGIPNNKPSYTCSELIKYTLLMLRDNNAECYDEVDKELDKWIDLFCSSDQAVIHPNNGLLFINQRGTDEYFIIKERGQKVFAISSSGETKINTYLDDTNNLLIDDLFIGYITIDGVRLLTLLSKKDGYYYPVYFDEDKEHTYEERRKENAVNLMSLKDALILTGHQHLIEPLYDKKTLEYVLTEIKEAKSLVLMNNKTENYYGQKSERVPADDLNVFLKVTNMDKYIELDYELIKGTTSKSTPKTCLMEATDEKHRQYVISLNDLLSIIRLKIFSGIMPDIIASQLRSDTYKYNELECIMRCIKGQYIPLSDITLDKKIDPNKKLDL